MRTRWRWMVGLLVLLAACGGSDADHDGHTPAAAGPDACDVLDRQQAAVAAVPDDITALDRSGIDAALAAQAGRLHELAAAEGAVHPEMLREKAEFVDRARPEVVARWGEHDGTELEARAYADRRFDIVPQAMVEAGEKDATRWPAAVSNVAWAVFTLAARCHGVAPVATSTLSARLATDRPPVPVLALDLAAGRQLVRVAGDGPAAPVGSATAGFTFPTLAPDGRTVAGGQGRIRTLTVDGTPIGEVAGQWDCAGWLGDGSLVVGRYQGVHLMRFEAADDLGSPLEISGGFCPVAAASPQEVLIQAGGRADGYVAVQRAADGSTVREIRRDGCLLTSPSLSRQTGLVALSAACDDPLGGGIWVADPAGGLTHVLTCVCGVATFSPDGKWLSFVVVPAEGADAFDTRLAFAHPDGTDAFHLPDGRLSFPLWPDLG